MIHYTLLPEKEIKSLKKEYRIRLIIFLFFFISCAVLVGIFSLLPAFILSYTKEKDALNSLESLQKISKDVGNSNLIKELATSSLIVNKLKAHQSDLLFSKIISQIINHKPQGLSIRSFGVSTSDVTASSTAFVTIQGKSSTRDVLIQFKNKLESDPLISGVELPVSDLAKSKDISYSLKISIITMKLK